jgi:cobalamin biosynthesis Mg chelatase CobN
MRKLQILSLMVALVGCATTRPLPADVPALSVHQDSLRRDSLARLPAYLVPAPAGSTKRQRRQWQRAQAQNLARAGHAPATVKVKNSTVATGSSTAVSTAKNSSAAVGTGATSTTIGKAKAPVASAPQAAAVDASTTKKGFPWWILIVAAVLGALLGLNRLIRGRWLL